jgi:ribosomal protein S18 acetylase RimI-like enzyme
MPPAFTSDALQALIFRCDYLWVVHNDFANAKGGHNVEETVIGYMGMTMQHWCQNGVLMCMGVAPSFRRKKIATQLLDAANATARQLNLRTLSCEVSTKNVPASRFLKAQNFRLCGYSDGFHNAQEIVLYFVARVR